MSDESLCDFIQKYKSKNKKFIKTNFSDISVGDIIYIIFFPYSQKYIDDLTPIYGTVKEIKDELSYVSELDDDIYFDKQTIERLILELNGQVVSGSHGWVSYFGNSRGYEYTIYKLKNISLKSRKVNEKNSLYISSDSSDDEIYNSNILNNNNEDTIEPITKKLKKTH